MDLDDFASAEPVIKHAREVAGDNEAVNTTWFFFLLGSGRVDELKREFSSVEVLDANNPQQALAFRHDQFRRGLVGVITGNNVDALAYFERSKQTYDEFLADGNTITLLSMMAVAQQRLSHQEAALASLEILQRLVTTARSGGINVPEMFYIEAINASLSGDVEDGFNKLEQAFEVGFRKLWLVEIDFRLDGLRSDSRFSSFIGKLEQAVLIERESLNQPVLTMR